MLQERDDLKELGVDECTGQEWILMAWNGRVWTGFVWLSTETSRSEKDDDDSG
jgi:hypothetical protein